MVLHEKMSGYSGTRQAMQGFAEKCAEHGVRVISGVTVTGYDRENGRVKRVLTDRGDDRRRRR